MKQYLSIKSKYSNFFLFYQIGDFYELFYDDARKISVLLNLTLTNKNFVKHENVPMAGVPVNSVDYYVLKLINLGESVVICDQVNNFVINNCVKKKLIDRKVVRIITPGTISDDIYLKEHNDNVISSVWSRGKEDVYGYSVLDVISGRFCVYELKNLHELKTELLRTNPVEILYPDNFFRLDVFKKFNCIKSFSVCEFGFKKTYSFLLNHFKILDLCCFGINVNHLGIRPAGFLLDYVKHTQFIDLSHINRIELSDSNNSIFMDYSTIKNLELVDSLFGVNKNTLFYVLNNTLTPMGCRMLKRWILSPLNDLFEINRRHNIMDIISSDVYNIRDILCGIGDLERILGRIVLKNVKVKDLINFKNYLKLVVKLTFYLKKKSSLYIFDYILSNVGVFNVIIDLINESIKVDVGDMDVNGLDSFILDGYSVVLDNLRKLIIDSQLNLSFIEEKEKKLTGIKSLCLKYNKIHGYYLQIRRSDVDLIPDYYICYRSLKNHIRYTIPELNKYESELINLKRKLFSVEKNILNNILDNIILNVDILKNVFDYISQLDVLSSFVDRSINLNYKKPVFVSTSIINIINGRHPVLENNLDLDFVCNDLFLDENVRLLLITGPNMAGKSTYMRQVALICVMAYIGCYVPADSATIGPIDKILTRIGFTDDIVSGKSTFMIEMMDIANIIHLSSKDSLVLIDEMGRGTSINDGISLAWACLEYISTIVKSFTLFSTHYLELTKMKCFVLGIENVYFDYIYVNKKLILLYKLKKGVCNKSYGLNVAYKSGIPKSIIDIAFKKLKELNFMYKCFNYCLKNDDYLYLCNRYKILIDKINFINKNLSILELIDELKILKKFVNGNYIFGENLINKKGLK